MKQFLVEVQPDYLATISSSRSPIIAIGELIWNSLDAEADLVNVALEYNPIGGLDKIMVQDNGLGLQYSEAETIFKNLGGSWKKKKEHSLTTGRSLHGKYGKGRFKAFSLGEKVVWNFTSDHGPKKTEFSITGKRSSLSFELSDPQDVMGMGCGTTVTINGIDGNFPSLQKEVAIPKLTDYFALYLFQYPGVKIWYDHEVIDPSQIVKERKEYAIRGIQLTDGRMIDMTIVIVEWKSEKDRKLYLCDADGFALHEINAAIHAPGFHFSVYLKSDYFKALEVSGVLLFDEMTPDVSKLVGRARDEIKKHFREVKAQRAKGLVQQWKKEKIYPYSGEPKTLVERAKRQVFDICAYNVNNYLPEFETSSVKSRKLALFLLKHALEENPNSLQGILQNILELPEDKKAELTDLLKRTTLSAIIDASREVTNRLDFLAGLEAIVFDKEGREHLLERRQLQKIIAGNTWIFGEQYNLWGNDESLQTVLRKYYNEFGIDGDEACDPVDVEGQSKAIVDIWLSRVSQGERDNREHLIIELKRPSEDVGLEQTQQIQRYAFAIIEDERFSRQNTSWHFYVLSNEITAHARRQIEQDGKPVGLLWEGSSPKCQIWIKTWAEIIGEARSRLSFFQQCLEYTATKAAGIEYLRATYQKYVPDEVLNANEDGRANPKLVNAASETNGRQSATLAQQES